MNCSICSLPIEADGYGEYVHIETARYECEGGGEPTFAVPAYRERRRP